MILTRRALAALLLAAPSAALAQATPRVENAPRAITPREAYEAQQAGKAVIVDIRTPQEWKETGVPKGAVRLDMTARDFVEKLGALSKANPGKDLALICRTSSRSQRVVSALVSQGWSNVVDVAGGVAGSPRGTGWFAEGLPVEK